MNDKDLTPAERDLAEVTMKIAEGIDLPLKSPVTSDLFWVEEHTPPDTEDDVLTSILYTGQGDPNPKAGFTLWRKDSDVAYRVTIERLES